MNIGWGGLLFIYAIIVLPYIVMGVAGILLVRDIIKKKFHTSTLTALIVTIVLFIIVLLLEGVI